MYRVALQVAGQLERYWEMMGKSQLWMEVESIAQSPFRKYNFGHGSQKL